MPDLIAPGQVVFECSSFTDEANWKLLLETSMEGYHIKALHSKSFYPYGYDNLNVVETYGTNSRSGRIGYRLDAPATARFPAR